MTSSARLMTVFLPLMTALVVLAPGSAHAWWAAGGGGGGWHGGGWNGGGYYGGGWRGGFYGGGVVVAPPVVVTPPIYAPYYATPYVAAPYAVAPAYVPPPAPPGNDGYYPPLTSSPATSQAARSCQAARYVCPLEAAVPPGGSCYCPGNNGQRVYGKASG